VWQKRRQEAFLDLAVEYWHLRGFPYYELTPQQICRELQLLMQSDPERVFRGNTLTSSVTGLRLANYFHPQMWHVRCTRYLSPHETFCLPDRLRAAIAKSMRIWPERHGARGSTLRRMLRSFSNTVGVSNFRPTAARAIIHRYSPPGGRVLDFSAGYGGRLLGALTLGRHYVGIDPCKPQVRGLRAMLKTCGSYRSLAARGEIILGAAEDLLPHYKTGSFDLVFSSPPYFDREKYGLEPDQSFMRYPTVDRWLESFLRVVLLQSARILRRGGRLVINIGTVPECLSHSVQEYLRPALRLQKTINLQLAKLPYKRQNAKDAFKVEPIFVFQKP
jgi:SAM-dependent methyltransferase